MHTFEEVCIISCDFSFLKGILCNFFSVVVSLETDGSERRRNREAVQLNNLVLWERWDSMTTAVLAS